jgi:hypothetical protein
VSHCVGFSLSAQHLHALRQGGRGREREREGWGRDRDTDTCRWTKRDRQLVDERLSETKTLVRDRDKGRQAEKVLIKR